MIQPQVRYACWDLSSVDLIDEHTQNIICPLYPLDKSANASGQRRALEQREPVIHSESAVPPGSELPPLLRKLMADYAATGQSSKNNPGVKLMNKTRLSLYGLKWNPFSQELPTEGVTITPKVEPFFWRIEQSLIREGGFAMITGDPGTGKSITLRLLAERLSKLQDLSVGAIVHPVVILPTSIGRWGICSVLS